MLVLYLFINKDNLQDASHNGTFSQPISQPLPSNTSTSLMKQYNVAKQQMDYSEQPSTSKFSFGVSQYTNAPDVHSQNQVE